MPFWVDDEGFCDRVIAAAMGMGGPPADHEALDVFAEEVFGKEDRFVEELTASPLPFSIERRQKGARNFVVTRGLVYIHVRSKPNVAIIAPPHFVTDFASVPAALRFLAPSDGAQSAAAVIHDWLYTVAEPPRRQRDFRKERFRADRIFLEAMRTSGVRDPRRSVLYRGARLFGRGGFGASSELRFVDPKSPDRLIDATQADKAALRAFTILPRPAHMKPPKKRR